MKLKRIFFLVTASIIVSCVGSDSSTDVKHIVLEPSSSICANELVEAAHLVCPEVGAELAIWGGMKRLVLDHISEYGDGRKRYFWKPSDYVEPVVLQQPQESPMIEEIVTLSCTIIGRGACDPSVGLPMIFRPEPWTIGELYQSEPGKSFEFLGVLNTSRSRTYIFLSLVA